MGTAAGVLSMPEVGCPGGQGSDVGGRVSGWAGGAQDSVRPPRGARFDFVGGHVTGVDDGAQILGLAAPKGEAHSRR